MPETANLAAALAAFQAKIPAVVKSETAKVPTKTGGSYQYTYASLGQVTSIVMPLLGAVGLSFTAKPTVNAAGKFVLAYELKHSSGESDGGEYPLPSSGTPQEYGSAITYARRYTLCSVTGVAPDEDDDGAAASTRTVIESPAWDPVEQEVLVAGWSAEIEDAKTFDEIKVIGKKVLESKKRRELSPTSYEHLAKAGAARKAELNGAEAAIA